MSDKDAYTDSQREEYEAGQKEGSNSSALGSILGPGFVSDEYQAGFNNGAENRNNDNWIEPNDD
jgi:hypothetical protein